MNPKVKNFISKLQDPSDRIAMMRRFNISAGTRGLEPMASYKPEPVQPTPVNTPSGVPMDHAAEAAYRKDVDRFRAEHGQDPVYGEEPDFCSGDGEIRTEADYQASLARMRSQRGY